MIKKSILVSTIAIFYLVLGTSLTFAQEPDYDRINEIAKDLNCPTCSGINLADCRTQTCAQWKDQIGDYVEAGYTNQEVLDEFVARYGEQVLQEPPKSGFTLVLWILPFIALIAGGVWLYYTLQRWANPEPASTAVATAPESVRPTKTSSDPANASDEYLSQVERDLGLDET